MDTRTQYLLVSDDNRTQSFLQILGRKKCFRHFSTLFDPLVWGFWFVFIVMCVFLMSSTCPVFYFCPVPHSLPLTAAPSVSTAFVLCWDARQDLGVQGREMHMLCCTPESPNFGFDLGLILKVSLCRPACLS